MESVALFKRNSPDAPASARQKRLVTQNVISEYLIALGSNLGSQHGDTARTLQAALAAFPEHNLRLRRLSRFFATPCFPKGAGPDYVNACALVEGPADSAQMLTRLHAIEAEFGRDRQQRWAARALDLDLLAGGATVLPDARTQQAWRDLAPEQQRQVAPETLIMPHPRLQERAFVLVPLRDIAAQWWHPLLGQTTAEMCAALPRCDVDAVVPLAGISLRSAQRGVI